MTTIQWTDETWNPTTGCSRVSEGCRNCYIERTPPFRMAGRKLGDPVQLHHDRLDAPLHWKKPRRVFVNSLSDLFHEDVSWTFILSVFTTMEKSPQHTFQILTKRPERMLFIVEWVGRKFMEMGDLWPLPNVWLGVSVEDQKTADERIPILLQVPAAVRFLSVEPLLGPVDLIYSALRIDMNPFQCLVGLHWVIVGGESGPKARPCDLAWIRSIVNQCERLALPCFVKQLGRFPVDSTPLPIDPKATPLQQGILDVVNEHQVQRQIERITDKKGGNPEEWPADLRVREWPR